MIPPEFEYLRASTLEEAIEAVADRPDARPLAGGQSLLPLLKMRVIRPGLLVDIGRLPGLRDINVEEEETHIGPLTTHRQIEMSRDLARTLPIMHEAADVLADPPVRNRGTFGGSLAFADPAGDWPAVALALEARITVSGPEGERTIDIGEYFRGEGKTALQHAEIITRITLPRPRLRTGMAYLKLRHPSSGYAMVGVAAVVRVDDAGVCRHCRLAITGAGPKAVRAQETEREMEGHPPTAEIIAETAEHGANGMEMSSDIYAGEEYRAHLVRVHARWALLTAVERLNLGT